MKHSIVFISLIVLAGHVASAQKINWTTSPENPIVERYTLNHYHLSGPVEVTESRGLFSVEKKTFSTDGLLLQIEQPLTNKYGYKNGRLLFRIAYNDTTHYTYNAAGQIISRRYKNQAPDLFSYTKKGQLAEMLSKDLGTKTKYIYDEKDRLKQQISYDKSGKPSHMEEHNYSITSLGLLKVTSRKKFATKDKTIEQLDWYHGISIYNVQGDKLQTSFMGGDTSRFLSERMSYDYMGNKLAVFSTNGPSFQQSVKYFSAKLPPKDSIGCKGGDCISGYGNFKYKDKEYQGFFDNGLPNGYGVMMYKDGSNYTGRWQNGVKEGYVTHTLPNKKFKSGIYHNDLLDGPVEDFTGNEPKYALYSKNKLIKEFKALRNDSTNRCLYGDCKDGYGVYIFENGTQYRGFFQNGLKKMGRINFKTGDAYQGSFDAKGLYNGMGTYQFANGDTYVGEWLNDKYHGGGSYYRKDLNTYNTGWYIAGNMSYAL